MVLKRSNRGEEAPAGVLVVIIPALLPTPQEPDGMLRMVRPGADKRRSLQ